jgi:hypothetical protein
MFSGVADDGRDAGVTQWPVDTFESLQAGLDTEHRLEDSVHGVEYRGGRHGGH